MTLRVVPETLICREFGGLEAPDPKWMEEVDYWEDYNRRFFRANGEAYETKDSNVKTWLTAQDRAPYAFMARELLTEMADRVDLSDIGLVLMAHWMPDIHLGTSVTNFALHHLNIKDGFGFAISDRGRTAPLFAMHCASKYLKGDRRKALLLAMDQKHLLYRSSLVDALAPANSAAAMVLERDAASGLSFRGYRRRQLSRAGGMQAEVAELCREMGMPPEAVCLIAEADVQSEARHRGRTIVPPSRFLCSAPFAALLEADKEGRSDAYLLVATEQDGLSAVMLATDAERVAV